MRSSLATIAVASCALLPSLLLAAPITSNDDEPLPIILWHGLGDNFAADGIAQVAELAESVHPGVYVYPIRLDEDANGDRRASFFGNTTDQIATVCAAISTHPILSQYSHVDALGFSQGGLFVRGLAQRCETGPRIRNMVTFGSPHNGIAEFAGCKDGDFLCRGAMALLRTNTWSHFVQSRLVPAQYYRSRDPETGNVTEEFVLYSNLLADLNNERPLKNKVYAERIAALEHLVLYDFDQDTTVIPRESEWFGDVDVESGATIPLKNRTMYEEDWLGLRKLDEKGGLVFRTAEGPHMHLTEEVLIEAFQDFFGPSKKGRKSEGGNTDL